MGSLSGDNNGESAATWFALGVSHVVTRTIDLYALFTMTINEKTGTYGLGQFQGTAASGSGNVPGLPDRNVAAFSVGFKMAFQAQHTVP